ncbi:plastocyanin/azurin family copper-binding protein [Pontibacter vulgaris]|uniref:plastocyanin/azurin family copper-binding protein n=1 Tax=Pontibacter vulgaris TaxID=2905679 RepID=UPI001FA74613|nr:plastocyanin/azurin family copper-binding protein [Pontibacter vulgaris]
MRKVTAYFLGFILALSMAACGNQGKQETAEQTVPASLPDSIAVSQTVASDSTLQVVEELTLKALGDTITDIRYDHDTLKVKANSFVKLTLINEGTKQPMVHNVVITEEGKYKLTALAGAKIGPTGNYIPASEVIIAASPLAKPGQSVIIEFTAPAKQGSYDYVCTYPGHWRRMHGKLIVY